MTHLYFDASALVKKYHPEAGSVRVNTLITDAANDIYISELVIVELTSAIIQLRRIGQFDVNSVHVVLAQFSVDVAQRYVVIPPPANWVEEACRLIEQYDLRALDAIHLAIALSWNAPSLVFVCADEKLLAAAAKAGLSVLNPLT